MAKPKQTPAQTLLGIHLRELGIETVPEYRFDVARLFRFDLYAPVEHIGFEVNGHFQGRHGAGWSKDAEKINLAQMLGYRVLVFTNKQVLRGEAKEWLKQWL